MKKILITACGGPSSLSFTRSLRFADPKGDKYFLIGTDCDPYNIHRSEVDKSYLCPKASDPAYIPFLINLILKEKIVFLHSQPEIEAYTIGKHREKIIETGCRLFLPKQSTVELLRDKWLSYKAWKNGGIKVPKNLLLNSPKDLKEAFDLFGNDIWIRENVGAAGKGALSRPTFDTALNQIDQNKAWGKTIAAEHLTPKTITWQSIWHEGKLVVAQTRLRYNWAFGNRAQSGVTGLTGVGEIVSFQELDKLAINCIKATDSLPNGIFSVDFTYDKDDIPNPTEINIGKFFTTHYFVTKTGSNMPHILTLLACDEYIGQYNIINPCQEGMLWIRGIDVEPILIHKNDIDIKIREFAELSQELQKKS
jgi:hypothetical protein